MDRADGAPNGRAGWREVLGLLRMVPATRYSLSGTARRPQSAPEVNPYLVRSQAARGESSPRRYVGRAGTAGAPQPSGRAGAKPPTAPLETSRATNSAAMAAPWSLRLMVAVSFVCLLALGVRVPGVTTSPIDVPTGVEATHAAFASVISGGVSGALDTVRYYPPAAPWHGLAPVDPAAGLPVFGWLSAFLLQIGGGIWMGRVLSMLFSVVAGLLLFLLLRATAGARAALYGLLFFAISPLSIVLGQHYSPATLMLASQALAMLTLFYWRVGSLAGGRSSSLRFGAACGAGIFAALVDPGSVFLLLPAAYIALAPAHDVAGTGSLRTTLWQRGEIRQGWRASWEASPHRGRLIGYGLSLVGAVALGKLMMSGTSDALALAPADGGGGIGYTLESLLQAGTYVQLTGALMEKLLTITGALLLFGGLMHGARRPFSLLYHAWLGAALLHVLADSGRIARHEDALLPLILPACALVGIGAAWAGSLPARVWLAITEQRRDSDVEYNVSPHTAWLLDLPEEVAPNSRGARPQAQVALGKSIAQRTQVAGYRARRASVMALGNFVVLGALALMLYAGWGSVQARLQPSVADIELKQEGQEIRAATGEGSRVIIVGAQAAPIFYSSGRTGWAMPDEEFSIAEVQRLQRDGALYLLSTDQEWLGRQPDYVGMLTSYSVAKLGRNYILFDLNTKPTANDRLYFLESGHTLGGEFKQFWQQNGGVAKLGYPVSEEIEEVNPLDAEKRRVQYFERAVLEYHPELAGTPDAVMLASVGRWVTQGHSFPTVQPFTSTASRAYFEQTGHSVKEAFLRYWQREGGVKMFGYPLSEELPEISSADGKVYTVQYFERARLEWHPTAAGTEDEVQLGLLGKQAWESRK